MIRLSDWLRQTCGEKIYRLSLSSGCTCPNRDGTAGFGGCTFCSEGGSGDFAARADLPLGEQIREAKKLISGKTDARKFIAYFQSFTNTYGDVRVLEPLYTEAASRNDVAFLSLGTRPDALPPEIMEMLVRLSRIKPVWIELGLQTSNDRTAEAFHRGYPLRVFDDAYRRLKDAGLSVVVHVIFGLPGEDRGDMLETIRYLAGLEPAPDGVKIQALQVLKGTELGRKYEREPFPLLTLEEYSSLIVESMKILPDDIVLHRMTGDGPRRLLIGPKWCLDKKRVLNTLNRALREAGM